MAYYINSKGKKVIGNEYKIDHPNGMIELINGDSLTCYEKTEGDDGLANEEAESQLCKLFTDNAFYLLAHRERILSNSRMFLCPIDVKSGLMYSGFSGFKNPTLGIFLEWWNECPESLITDSSGMKSLVYRLAGSPLSGMNHSSIVDEKGEIRTISLSSFINYWPSFIGINTRYSEAKKRYQAYSLAKVLEILHSEDDDSFNLEHEVSSIFLQGRIRLLNNQIISLRNKSKLLNKKYDDLLYKTYGDVMLSFYNEYKVIEKSILNEKQQVMEHKRVLKANLRNGIISLRDYEPQRHEITRQLSEISRSLSDAKWKCEDEINRIIGEDLLTFETIKSLVTRYNRK